MKDTTPTITESGKFKSWLQDTYGQDFMMQYYEEAYQVIEQEDADMPIKGLIHIR